MTGRSRLGLLVTGSLQLVFLSAILTLTVTGIFSSSDADFDQQMWLAYVGTNGYLENLPLRVDMTEPLGWKGSIRCVKGWGRYYRKLAGDQADPLMLLFDMDDRLIGVNLHSPTEQPVPWVHLPKGMQAGIDGREMEYWDLNIFLIKPVEACRWRLADTRVSDDW